MASDKGGQREVRQQSGESVSPLWPEERNSGGLSGKQCWHCKPRQPSLALRELLASHAHPGHYARGMSISIKPLKLSSLKRRRRTVFDRVDQAGGQKSILNRNPRGSMSRSAAPLSVLV